MVAYEDIDDDQQSLTWSADISYRLSAPITLALMFSQDFDNSATGGLIKSRDTTFSIDYVKDSFRTGIAAYWTESKYQRIIRDDKAYGGLFNLSFPLYSNLSTDFSADYEKASYETATSDKDVDNYSLGLSFDYEISRFLTSLSYRYRVNDSEINIDDYTENTVTLSVRIRF